MPHPDLLTDEDLATRHEPPKGRFNQFVSVADNYICCSKCHRELAKLKGDMFSSCCPPTFPTYEEALADTREECARTGAHLCDYIGTFEL